MSTYPRFWAAIGNVLRLSAFVGFIVGLILAYAAIQDYQSGATGQLFVGRAIGAAVFLILSVLLWLTKAVLVSGRPFIVRWLVGAYMLFWVISTLGIGAIVIAIAYALTGDDVDWKSDQHTRNAPRVYMPKPPANWSASGRVGPSGASVYTDASRSESLGVFDSYVPVQIVDRRSGFAYVIAASGARGWIDQRTLMEPT